VLRLEAQVRTLQDSLKTALTANQTYSIRAGGAPDACLSSGSAAAGKAEVFVGACGTPEARNWKIQPAQP